MESNAEKLTPIGGGLWRRIAGNASLSVFGAATVVMFGIVRTALLTKSLTIGDFGRVLLVLNFYSLLVMILSFRVSDLVLRFVPRFRDRGDEDSLRAVIRLAFGLELILALICVLIPFFGADIIAAGIYGDMALANPLKIYAVGGVLSAFAGFASAFNRLENRFAWVVVPQILGAGVTVGFLLAVLVVCGAISLELALCAFLAGRFLDLLIPLAAALYGARRYFPRDCTKALFRPLAESREAIFSCLFQTKIGSVLKTLGDRGGLFLLGVFASAEEAAIFGVAQQLVRPFELLQSNIQSVIAPEITGMHAASRTRELLRFVQLFAKGVFLVVVMGVVAAWLVIDPVLALITTESFESANVAFVILSLGLALTITASPFYHMTLVMERFRRRNLVVAGGGLYLLLAVLVGISAVHVALARLAAIVTTRMLSDLPVYLEARRLAGR